MPDDESPDTRRTGGAMPPPRPVPTLLTLQSALDVLTGQVRGYREEVDAALAKASEQAVLRFSAPPSPDSLAPPPPRPSMAAKAAHGTAKVSGKVLAVLGAVAAIGQVAAVWMPQYAGPIAQALRLLAALVSGGSDP